MPNSYVSLDYLKDRGVLNIEGTTDDVRIRTLAEAVSRQVDGYTRRHFYAYKGARHLSGNGRTRIFLPWDLIVISSCGFAEDDNEDGSFNTIWSSSDYHGWPYDANPTEANDQAQPITALEVNLNGGDQDVFLKGRRNYQVTGRFGYREYLEDTGANTGSTTTGGSTAIVLDKSTKVSAGETLLVGSEQLYVLSVSSSDASTDGKMHITRAVNGTTGAAHSSSADIDRYVYPEPVREAVLMQFGRLWTRRAASYANQVGFSETGQVTPVQGLDADVRQMLAAYRKPIA